MDRGQDQGRPDARRPRRTAAGFVMGRPFGIPVHVSPTWFLVAALITVVFAPTVDSYIPGLGGLAYLVAFAFAVLLYLSVLVHELAHSVVAQRFGLPVRRISLYLLGGVSEIEREPETPGREFAIAVAGPVLSLLLALAGFGLAELLEAGTVLHLLMVQLAVANALVGVFNLLPGLPLDGGRVLQAAVWRATGRRSAGMVGAGWVGRGLAVLVLAVPVLAYLATGGQVSLVSILWGALLASFVWAGASQSIRAGRVRERLPQVQARALARPAVTVAADLPLSEALRRATEVGSRAVVIVDSTGRPTGVVSEAAVLATPLERRPWVSVGSLARGLNPELVLSADLGGEQLVRAMQAVPATEYLIVEAGGQIRGVLSSADVDAVFAGV